MEDTEKLKKRIRELEETLQKEKQKYEKLEKEFEEFNINSLNRIRSSQIREFLEKVPKKELLDSLQRVVLITR